MAKTTRLTDSQKNKYNLLKGGTIIQYDPIRSYKNTQYVGHPLEGETISVSSNMFSKLSQLRLVNRIEYTPLIMTYEVL